MTRYECMHAVVYIRIHWAYGLGNQIACIHTYIHTYIHAFRRTYMHVCICTHVRIWDQWMTQCECMHAVTYIRINWALYTCTLQITWQRPRISNIYTQMRTYRWRIPHIHTHTHMHTYRWLIPSAGVMPHTGLQTTPSSSRTSRARACPIHTRRNSVLAGRCHLPRRMRS